MKGFSKSTLAPFPQSNSSMGSVGIFAMDGVWGEVGAALLDRADNDGKPQLEVPADKGAFPSRCLLAYSRAMRLQACEKLRATTFMLPSNPS